jgi:hypothetical protein
MIREISGALMFHVSVLGDHVDGLATGQPQGVGPEAYLSGTSQGSTPEDARKEDHICGHSKRYVKYQG